MEQLVTFLAVLVGALASVVTTLIVERQKGRNEERRRVEGEMRQKRREFHELLKSLQESMYRAVELANDLADEADSSPREEEKRRLAERDLEARRLVLQTRLLAARLPDPRGQAAVDRFVQAAQTVRDLAPRDPSAARRAAERASQSYEEAVDVLAGPLRSYYDISRGQV